MGLGEVCGGVLPIPAEIVDCDGYGYRWEGLKNKSYYRSSHCTCTKLSETKLSEGYIIITQH